MLRDVLVLSVLVGVTDTDQAATAGLLGRIPGLGQVTPELERGLVGWLRLYGVVAGYHVRPHLPAVLTEHLIAAALADNPVLAKEITTAAVTQGQASYALAVLTSATSLTLWPSSPRPCRRRVSQDQRSPQPDTK